MLFWNVPAKKKSMYDFPPTYWGLLKCSTSPGQSAPHSRFKQRKVFWKSCGGIWIKSENIKKYCRYPLWKLFIDRNHRKIKVGPFGGTKSFRRVAMLKKPKEGICVSFSFALIKTTLKWMRMLLWQPSRLPYRLPYPFLCLSLKKQVTVSKSLAILVFTQKRRIKTA